jgi:hypothetical protein
VKRTDLEEETIREVLNILQSEFESWFIDWHREENKLKKVYVWNECTFKQSS